MGWAQGYTPDGREVGYAVEATCDEEGCEVVINRGLAYICGSMHGGEEGCGGYFCNAHLFNGNGPQKCKRCFVEEPAD